MHHRLSRKLLALLAVLAIFAASCGDDDDDTAGTETTDEAPAEEETTEEEAPAEEEATEEEAPAEEEATDGEATDEAAEPMESPCGGDMGEATGEPINVGSIQGATGPDDFSSSGKGAAAYFACLNAHGGIGGRPVNYIVEDDQWDPEVAASSAAKLVEDDNVIALVGSSSFVECGVNAQYYADSNVIAMYGTGVPRECFFSANISPTNSGPRISALGAAQYLVETYGVTSLSCVSQNIPNTGEWVCTGLEEWGEAAGVSVEVILHDPAAPDFPTIIQDAMASEPEGVILMEPAGLTVPLLAEAEAQELGDAARWAGPTSQYLAGFPETIGEYWWGRYDVQAELTTIDNESPDNQAWLATMDTYGNADDPRDTFSQAGWLAAKVFSETLAAMDPATIDDRDAVSDALRAVTNYETDLMCTPWYFGPGDRHNANHGGRVVTINAEGQYELVQDCAPVADPELDELRAFEAENGLAG
jgi:branched-chain amino acid transport system substrate-binding protein